MLHRLEFIVKFGRKSLEGLDTITQEKRKNKTNTETHTALPLCGSSSSGSSVEFKLVQVGPGEVVVLGDVAPPVEGVEQEERHREQDPRQAINLRNAVDGVTCNQQRGR